MHVHNGLSQKHHNKSVTDEIKEFVNYRPNWIVRKANIIFLLIISLLIVFASLIKYPDIITGHARLIIQEPGNFYSEVRTEKQNLDKFKVGQKVILKLNKYSNNEFLYLNGNICGISNLPDNKDSLVLRVRVTTEFQTHPPKIIQFIDNLTTYADIITDDKSLIHRLIIKIKKQI
jgi:hypothetical protein